MKSGFSLPSSRYRFSENRPLPSPVRLIVFKYCLGMIMSVSTLIILSGSATPSRTVNLSIFHSLVCHCCCVYPEWRFGERSASRNARLDGVHIVVGEPEMVPDLVHQHVLDDGAQRLVVLGPIVEDRPPVEPDHVRHLHRRALVPEREADPLEQAEQVELALGPQIVEHLIGRKILDPNDQVLAQCAELARQVAIGHDRDGLDLLERGCLEGAPGKRVWEGRHGPVVSIRTGAAKRRMPGCG